MVHSCVRLSGWSASQPARCLTWCKLFNQLFFRHAMLVDTIDFSHSIPLSLILTLAGGHKVSTKQNLLASLSHTLFNSSAWNVIVCWSKSSCTSCFCYRLVGLAVKASASGAEDPGFDRNPTCARIFVGRVIPVYQWLKNWHSSGYPARRLVF